jgi:nucleoside-diphosphate-sugar epimerase
MSTQAKQKAVVTGGAGFIGSHLVRALLTEGYEVHVIDNYAAGRFPERVSSDAVYHEGDIRDAALLEEVLKDTSVVFHTAALPRVQFSLEHPLETHDVNVSGTLHVLEASRKAGVQRVVYSASSSAYGNQDQLPLIESMQAHPISPYALQKYVGEQYCQLYAEVYGLPTVSLRYFNVYGPHADPFGAYALVVSKFVQQRKEGTPLTIAGDGTNTRDYTHVRDIVRANILASKSAVAGKGEVFNIGGGQNISVLEVANLIGGEVTHIEARLEPKDTLADTSKAKELLGWESTIIFADGVRELKEIAGI